MVIEESEEVCGGGYAGAVPSKLSRVWVLDGAGGDQLTAEGVDFKANGDAVEIAPPSDVEQVACRLRPESDGALVLSGNGYPLDTGSGIDRDVGATGKEEGDADVEAGVPSGAADKEVTPSVAGSIADGEDELVHATELAGVACFEGGIGSGGAPAEGEELCVDDAGHIESTGGVVDGSERGGEEGSGVVEPSFGVAVGEGACADIFAGSGAEEASAVDAAVEPEVGCAIAIGIEDRECGTECGCGVGAEDDGAVEAVPVPG